MRAQLHLDEPAPPAVRALRRQRRPRRPRHVDPEPPAGDHARSARTSAARPSSPSPAWWWRSRLGVPLGLLAALVRNSWLDVGSMLVALLGVSMPSFWLGLLLIFVFSLHLGWFPATGGGDLRHLVLPALTLGMIAAAIIARLTRSSMLEVLGQDYVRTARAKGLGGWSVVVRHALKNALIPVVTIFGLQFGNLLAGRRDRGDRVQPAGARPADRRRHPGQGLPARAGHRAVRGHGLRADQRPGRRRLRLRSIRASGSASAGSAAAAPPPPRRASSGLVILGRAGG